MRIGLATMTSIHAARSLGRSLRPSSLATSSPVRAMSHGSLPEGGQHGVELGRGGGVGQVLAHLVGGAAVVEDLLRLAALRAAGVVPEGQVGHGAIVGCRP